MKTKLVILNGDFPDAVSRERIEGNSRMRTMKILIGLFALCLIGSFNFDTAGQTRQNAASLVADKLHTPPKGSAERQAIIQRSKLKYPAMPTDIFPK